MIVSCRLTDLTWSADGLTLVASSTDGFCSVITFSKGELGDPLPEEPSQNTDEPGYYKHATALDDK